MERFTLEEEEKIKFFIYHLGKTCDEVKEKYFCSHSWIGVKGQIKKQGLADVERENWKRLQVNTGDLEEENELGDIGIGKVYICHSDMFDYPILGEVEKIYDKSVMVTILNCSKRDDFTRQKLSYRAIICKKDLENYCFTDRRTHN
jgi:hypothetical protein